MNHPGKDNKYLEAALLRAQAASGVRPAFLWVGDDKALSVSRLLPIDVLTRGGFFMFIQSVGRWVPRGSDDMTPENFLTS